MDPQRWQHIRTLFEQALEQPAEQRTAYLAAACSADADLHREVVLMLEAHADETPFLDDAPADEALRLLADGPAPLPAGAQIGPYRLVREIGHGGMGTVYLAERSGPEFKQQVALKIVRPGTYRPDLPERFRHERKILASLNHPYIARLLDGGVTQDEAGRDGRPYLVMEYVEGLPIDTYCDTHHLTTQQRLLLFNAVCQAVHYAHQNLIVHRDLKPSNILVSPPTPGTQSAGTEVPGVPKLLDFGIAKLLGEDGTGEQGLTRTGLRLMTPEYASPEQVRGDPITTAADVYALGIILYELLTGHRPYEVRGLTPSAIERVICEHPPVKPSTAVMHPPTPASPTRRAHADRLRRRLSGDLDTIVLKALQKEPHRRYSAVAELQEDIRRHLMQLPVRARPDTLGYRIRKFTARHTGGVVAAALVVLVLAGGILATTYQTRVAQRRFNEIRTLSNTLLLDLHDAIRDLPGATPARGILVSNAHAYLNALYQEDQDDPALQLELAEAYAQIGQIQGDPHYSNLGDIEGAMESYTKALHLREAVWRSDTTVAEVQHLLARSYGHLGVVAAWHQSNTEGIRLSTHALGLLAPLIAAHPDNLDLLHDAGRIQSELGWWLIFEAQYAEGLHELDQAVARLERVAAQHPEDLNLNLHLWRAYSYQIDGLRFSAQIAAALALLQDKGLPHLQRLAETHRLHPRVQYGLHVCYDYIGEMHQKLGHPEAALPAYQRSIAYAEDLVSLDQTNQKAHESLARAYGSFGMFLPEVGKYEEAVQTLKQSLRIREDLYNNNPNTPEIALGLAEGRRMLCRIYMRMNRWSDAQALCRQAADGYAEATTPLGAVYRGNMAASYTYMGRIAHRLALAAPSTETQQRLLRESLSWYSRAAPLFDQLETEVQGNVAWEVHPDSLRKEWHALQRLLQTDAKP